MTIITLPVGKNFRLINYICMNKPMYITTKGELVEVQLPVKTNTYKPVTHRELIDVTLEGIEKAGFRLGSEDYSWARGGKQANAFYTISDVQDKEMILEIGWQNSYDKSMSLKFAMGSRIFICSNGCVTGDLGFFKKKHVGQIQTYTPQTITESIKSAGDMFKKLQEDRDKLKEVEITRRITAELVGRMFLEEQIINSEQLNILKGEIDKPSFNYGCDGSAWQLYNHTTHALKSTHPEFYFQKHIKLHNLFSELID